jgi:iron complex transport system substrate-binding protein
VQKEYIDQMLQTILLDQVPKRIVSLVPSQTEYLHDLGLEDNIVGITKFCIHPSKWQKSKAIIGGTKNISIEKVRNLKPDLIIGNKEENSKEDIELLKSIAPVWMSDIYTLEDGIEMMRMLGEITGKENEALNITSKVYQQFTELISLFQTKRGHVLYLIWDKPVIGVGANTFIDDVLKKSGFLNVLENQERYPILDELNHLNPTHIFLSSEPFPFKEKHIRKYQDIFPNAKIQLVDGEIFSWYGSRLLKSVLYLKHIV